MTHVSLALRVARAPHSQTIANSSDAELRSLARTAAPLIAEHARFCFLFWSMPDSHPDLDAVGLQAEPSARRLNPMITRATELPASTPEGRLAKARLLRHALLRGGMYIDGRFKGDTPEAELAWSLVSDLLGRA